MTDENNERQQLTFITNDSNKRQQRTITTTIYNGNIFKETYLFDTNNANIYRGNDLLYGASFRNTGCIYNDAIFAIDIKRPPEDDDNLSSSFLLKAA